MFDSRKDYKNQIDIIRRNCYVRTLTKANLIVCLSIEVISLKIARE